MESTTERHVPGFAQDVLFAAWACCFRVRRSALELFKGSWSRPYRRGRSLVEAPCVAEVQCPIWTGGAGSKDRALTAGKVHNIRVALRGIDGIEVPADAVFSFWRQIGRPSRGRGFVDGRELREGCLIASPGGGLCQLSNALYEAALRAGFDIVERHAHSRIVPGSRAALGRDATVFWNYVDLRFRSAQAFRIEARLTSDTLVVAFRANRAGASENPSRPEDRRAAAHDCLSCGQSTCRRHNPERAAESGRTAAWLVDGSSAEFSALFSRCARPCDALVLPTRRLGARRYAWPTGLCRREASSTVATLQRSLALRHAGQGAAFQARSLAADARLAAAHAARLSHLDTEVFVSQNLLPHLWRLGVLQGRRVSVLMQRLPLHILQARLDAAAVCYPQSPTLADFRAPAAIVEAEREALGVAHTLYTAHPDIASVFPKTTVLFDWAPVPALAAERGGTTLFFPASALARKGAYALREAIDGLDLDLVVAGPAVETPNFWGDRAVRILGPGERLSRIAAVVLPAIVEHQPRALMAALAAGLPTIATPACGLAPQPGLTLVPPMDAGALREAIRAFGTWTAPQG